MNPDRLPSCTSKIDAEDLREDAPQWILIPADNRTRSFFLVVLKLVDPEQRLRFLKWGSVLFLALALLTYALGFVYENVWPKKNLLTCPAMKIDPPATNTVVNFQTSDNKN